jgi:hypothetical protein
MLLIKSSCLEVEILPEVGGKIGHIRDRASGYELLIAPQKPYRTIPEDGNWTEYDTSGMDDCFPNIAAGPYPFEPWTGTQLPDIGHWSHGIWDVCDAGDSQVTLERRVAILPHRARKSIRFLDATTVELSYRVENCGDSSFGYMWAAHPLISAGSEFGLTLPSGDLSFRTFPSDEQVHSWPLYGSTDLSREWIPRGNDLKIFVTGMREGWCELELPSHTLRLTFDLAVTPVLGIWFNHFGFPQESPRPFRCVAVEPCTSPSDLLSDLRADEYRTIEPGAVHQWSIQLELRARGR